MMDSVESNKFADEPNEAGMNSIGIENVDTEIADENNASAEIKSSTFGFTESSWKTDFCLVVEGTKLYVAKNILSLASPVFDTMFQSDFKEKSSDELELPGKKLSDVIAFLRCIYPNTCADINRDNALAILPLVEEYQVLQLKTKCEAVMVESATEETSVQLLQLLKQACMYDLKNLRSVCISILSSRPCDALDENFCKSFPSTTSALNEILLNVNTSMKSKLAELELVAEENELLKKYISSEVLARNLQCDPNQKWDNKTVVLTDIVPTSRNNKSMEKLLYIWGIHFKVCVIMINEKLYCEIKNVGQMVVNCNISARCMLVNRQPTGCNQVINKKFTFFSSSQVEKFMISDMSTVEGFVNSCDGNVGIIIHFIVTQPELKKRKLPN